MYIIQCMNILVIFVAPVSSDVLIRGTTSHNAPCIVLLVARICFSFSNSARKRVRVQKWLCAVEICKKGVSAVFFSSTCSYVF